MSLRHNAKPFTSTREVRRLFRIIYDIARERHHVASLAGSCALHGKGNDLDVIIVPMWQAPTDPYPVRVDHEHREWTVKLIAEAVGGSLPDEYDYGDGHMIGCRVDQWSGIVQALIWLPDDRTIDVKVWPGQYVREDIRKSLDHQCISRKDIVDGKLWPFPKIDSHM